MSRQPPSLGRRAVRQMARCRAARVRRLVACRERHREDAVAEAIKWAEEELKKLS